MSTVIKVENLYKQYRLGEVNTGSLVQDLNRWWYQVRGKDDPYEKITIANERYKKRNSEFVWALQDINFEVKQGEVLGIIGKNGAGKSTLLKILSKVTSPTRGEIKVRGRIASLLEVGTGFHPELTGRENIFLNGAILGMTKTEIRLKFDEIVAFSGVEQYIDTPVKRYSSGMYVRLAFAVAAHLEPEILIVDEVLAVGDAEFQKKCLGKMKDVSGEGRTVLFVSHNMEAVEKICNSILVMNYGKVQAQSKNVTSEIFKYLNGENANSKTTIFYTDEKLDSHFQLHSVCLVDEFDQPLQNPLWFNEKGFIEILGTIHNVDQALRIGYKLLDSYENILFYSFNTDLREVQSYSKGSIKYKSMLPLDILNNGRYTIVPVIDIFHRRDIKLPANALVQFELIGNRSISLYYPTTRPGVLAPLIDWVSTK